jgi:hypothetical protein
MPAIKGSSSCIGISIVQSYEVLFLRQHMAKEHNSKGKKGIGINHNISFVSFLFYPLSQEINTELRAKKRKEK